MLSVLAISNLYPPHHLGGYELSCRDVMTRMVAAGHRVTVLTTTTRRPGVDDPPGERDGHGPGGVAVWRDLEWWWDDHVLTHPPLPTRLRLEARSHAALRRALRTIRPDVVSVWNMGAMSLGVVSAVARAGVPIVFNMCDDWLVYGPRLDAWGRLFRGTGRRLAGRAFTAVSRIPTAAPGAPWPGVYLFISDATRTAALTRTGWDLPVTAVVGSGIDPDTFPVNTEPVVDRPWGGRVLFVGRVEARKGVEPLVRALALLPDMTLVIDGPPEPAFIPTLEAVIAECGVADRVVQQLSPRDQLRAEYQRADVVVFPSLWSEPFGLVPIEAMACDTPVVASGTGGSAEFLIDGANCLVAPPTEPATIAAAISRLAGDSALRRRLVEGGRRTAAWADIGSLAAIVTDWHEYAAGGRTGDRPPERRPPRF